MFSMLTSNSIHRLCKVGKAISNMLIRFLETRKYSEIQSHADVDLSMSFSNSLIFHAALIQPEHLILVRWMGLETQWKTSWKHRRVWTPVFEHFLNLFIDKASKTLGDKQLYLITHFTKQTLNLNYLLLTLNVTEQFLKNPKQKRPFFF